MAHSPRSNSPIAGTRTGERAVYWRAPGPGELELLRATYVTHAFAPHSHEGFAFGVIEAGAERFRYRRGMHLAPAGSIVIINPGEPHTGDAALAGGWRYRMFYPSATLLQQSATALSGRARPVPFFPEPVVTDVPLARALVGLHATLEESPDPLERVTRLLTVFARLVQRHADTLHLAAEARPEPALARRVRDYLEAHLSEPVALADLAQVVGTSEFHLIRVFQQTTGLPPHAYLTQMRVTRAKHLLAQRVSPAQVAQLVGFYDQSHLTRHFKRIVGIPPAQYARHTI
jgi:AraC-like DNA-binding protein